MRGYTWTVIPITWRNRRTGEAKLKIKEMGSRYLFIFFYVWLEKYFSRGDYRKRVARVRACERAGRPRGRTRASSAPRPRPPARSSPSPSGSSSSRLLPLPALALQPRLRRGAGAGPHPADGPRRHVLRGHAALPDGAQQLPPGLPAGERARLPALRPLALPAPARLASSRRSPSPAFLFALLRRRTGEPWLAARFALLVLRALVRADVGGHGPHRHAGPDAHDGRPARVRPGPGPRAGFRRDLPFLLFAVGFYTRQTTLVAPAAALASLLLEPSRRRELPRALAAFAVPVLGRAPGHDRGHPRAGLAAPLPLRRRRRLRPRPHGAEVRGVPRPVEPARPPGARGPRPPAAGAPARAQPPARPLLAPRACSPSPRSRRRGRRRTTSSSPSSPRSCWPGSRSARWSRRGPSPGGSGPPSSSSPPPSPPSSTASSTACPSRSGPRSGPARSSSSTRR